MENGAFYVNTVGNVIKYENRLCGKIGIYEMPEYTATEIDEPDDWAIIEDLMRRHVLSKDAGKGVKLFLSDVDGTLTDGGMYYSERGDELKKFNTRDGMGFQLLNEKGIKTGVITSEDTKIVTNRAKKLKVDYVIQGQRGKGKLEAVIKICEEMRISMDEVAYIGDDVNCKELLKTVGFAACPSDAQHEITNLANVHVMNLKGGQGCVREFINSLITI
jgi:N-acylneuraminate cytidylyltransferase